MGYVMPWHVSSKIIKEPCKAIQAASGDRDTEYDV